MLQTLINNNCSNILMEQESDIKCSHCQGSGKVKAGALSGIESGKCRGCGVIVHGKTLIKQFEQHQGLCIECSGVPTGYERLTRKHEICSFCKKEAWQH